MTKIWTVFNAARYEDGILIEDFDGQILNPLMVGVMDYLTAIKALNHVARHFGSAEQCREIATEALNKLDPQIVYSTDNDGGNADHANQ